MNFLKTLLDQEQKNIAEGHYKDLAIKDQESKIEEAVEKAQEAFWASVTKSFPDMKFVRKMSPEATKKFDEACKSAVDTWLSSNEK